MRIYLNLVEAQQLPANNHISILEAFTDSLAALLLLLLSVNPLRKLVFLLINHHHHRIWAVVSYSDAILDHLQSLVEQAEAEVSGDFEESFLTELSRETTDVSKLRELLGESRKQRSDNFKVRDIIEEFNRWPALKRTDLVCISPCIAVPIYFTIYRNPVVHYICRAHSCY